MLKTLDIPGHDGAPARPDHRFLQDPPPEIGRCLSGWSNVGIDGRALGDSDEDRRASRRFAFVMGAIGGGLGAALLVFFLRVAFGPPHGAVWLVCIAAGAIWLGRKSANAGLGATSLNNFVGTEGVARVEKRGDRTTTTVVRFDEAPQLQRSLERITRNGIYQQHSAVLVLHNSQGLRKFETSTGWRENEPVTSDDGRFFLDAIERAFTLHVLPQLEGQWKAAGKTRFEVRHFNDGSLRGALTFSPGALTIEDGAAQQGVYRREDVGPMWARDGVLVIGEPGAKEGFFSSTGVLHRVSIRDVANFGAFQRAAALAGFSFKNL
jgi:hypothetical protein